MRVLRRCLLQRYSSLYSLAQLLEACPACRKACACSSCLRSADHMQLVPPLQFGAQQLARQAGYVLREVVPLLTGLLQQQQAEVRLGCTLGSVLLRFCVVTTREQYGSLHHMRHRCTCYRVTQG
jgi:hypothetical protein